MRTPFIAGNWKMHKTVAETVKYVKEFRGLVKDIADVEIVLAPTFTALHAAAEAARNSNVVIAAQDMYWEREGAFTGEVSAPMIREAGRRLSALSQGGVPNDVAEAITFLSMPQAVGISGAVVRVCGGAFLGA